MQARERGTTVKRSILVLSLAIGVGLALSGCEQRINVRGNLPDPEVVAEIYPGFSNRDDVVRLLGSPSTESTFEANKWYYIGQKTTQFAFFDPEVIDRSVLVVTFSTDGMVSDTVLYTVENGEIIDPVDRTTPTEGREMTVIQQLFGNLGRFPTESQE